MTKEIERLHKFVNNTYEVVDKEVNEIVKSPYAEKNMNRLRELLGKRSAISTIILIIDGLDCSDTMLEEVCKYILD